MDELKACPFCGEQPLLDHACLVRDTYWWVRCQNLAGCKVLPHGMQCLKEADAVAAWNLRPAFFAEQRIGVLLAEIEQIGNQRDQAVIHRDHLRAELALAGDMLRAMKARNDELNDDIQRLGESVS
jgi:hypothetical protein